MKKNITLILVIVLTIVLNSKSQSFLGFDQAQCTSTLGYSYNNFECSYNSYTYKIFSPSQLVFEKECPGVMGQSYSANNLLFINDSVGFHAITHLGSSFTPYKYVVKTTNSGFTWNYFSGPPSGFGPIMDFDYFVLNENAVFVVAIFYVNGPLSNHIFINNIIDSIDNDTVIHYPISGVNLCGIDTLSFNVYSGDTVNYKIIFDFDTEVQESGDIPEVFISPNPASNYLLIKTNNKFTKLGKVSIFDLKGRLIMSKKFENEIQLDIRNINYGVYFSKIEINDHIITKKILIQ